VSELPNGLIGKAKRVAQARKKKWEMSSGDWEFVDKLVKALEVRKYFFLMQNMLNCWTFRFGYLRERALGFRAIFCYMYKQI
jgi:hypothetical protein